MESKIIALLEKTMKAFPKGFEALVLLPNVASAGSFANDFGRAHSGFTYYALSMKLENKQGTRIWLRNESDIPYLRAKNFHHIIVAVALTQDQVDSLKPLLRIP